MIDDTPFTSLHGRNLRTNPNELRFMIETLEGNGYVVRRPSEADLDSVLEIEKPGTGSAYHYGNIGLRLDTVFNGVPYALLERVPIELLLHQDDASFREQEIPRMFGRKMAHYIADRFMPGIVAQVATKIKPLVPEKRMSLEEIVSHIASALYTTKHRIDPVNFDENDNQIKRS